VDHREGMKRVARPRRAGRLSGHQDEQRADREGQREQGEQRPPATPSASPHPRLGGPAAGPAWLKH
jgi:hypothetical protein